MRLDCKRKHTSEFYLRIGLREFPNNLLLILLGGDEEVDPVNVEPMRPLLRGYCSTLTLPSRRHYQRSELDNGGDYCDISIANGYLSDGEVLRNLPNREICDGYISEGGSALYQRKLHSIPAHGMNG